MNNFVSYTHTKEEQLASQNKDIEEEKHSNDNYKGIVCKKPWGYEFLPYESKKIGMWCLTVYKGHTTSLHCHFKKDTLLIVLSGCARIELIDGEVRSLSRMETIFIPRKKFHAIGSFSSKTCILEIEIFSNELNFSDKNDLLRINDQYHRKPVGYQSSVELITTGLEGYDYFSFHDTTKKIIDNVTLSFEQYQKQIPFQRNTHRILIHGSVYDEASHCILKEGSLLNNIQHYTPLGIISVLSISNNDWKDDSKVIHDYEQLKLMIKELRQKKQQIVLTSGCYDILHVGHLHTLKQAKSLGDTLIVCLSSDEQIKTLKGNTRPINTFQDRLDLFKTIECVDYIFPYQEDFIETEETLGSIMKIIDPDTWVKGSDYTVQAIQAKHPYLRNIQIIPLIENKSTTNIIKKIGADFKK